MRECNQTEAACADARLAQAAIGAVPKPPSPVASALNDAYAAARALEDNLSSLEGRLEPVLRKQSGTDGKGQPEPVPSCELEERLRDLGRRLHLINDNLFDLNQRVAL